MSVQDGVTHYERLIYQDDVKCYQLRLTVSEFREKYYLNLRKYFLSYSGEWIPSKDGVSMELTLNNIYSLMEGFLEVLSKAEGEEIITKYYNSIKTS